MRFATRRNRLSVFFLALGVIVPASASAQSSSLFGNRGPASQIGSNSRGSVVGGGMVGGSLGNMSAIGGSTGFGSTGVTAGRGGPSGLTGGMGMTGGGLGTTGLNGGGFIGAGNQAGFIGGGQVGVGTQGRGLQQMGRGGLQRMTGMGGMGGLGALGMSTQLGRGMQTGLGLQGMQRGGMMGGRQQQLGLQQQQQPVAQPARTGAQGQQPAMIVNPRHQVAFSHPQLPQSAVQTSLGERFQRAAQRQTGLSGVSIATDASRPGVVVLRGEVESADAAKLAATIARLEPGVREVRNELTVRGQ